MKKTPDINPESQDVAELQTMVKALLSEKTEWKQERQSLLEQLKNSNLSSTGSSPNAQKR